MTPSNNEGGRASGSPASDHLVRGVDFLFALTIGQGLLLFQPFWQNPFTHDHFTVFLALAAIYVTTVQSFIDWHISMEEYPYKVSWTEKFRPRHLERARFTVDLAIVAVYAFLAVNAVPFTKAPGTTLTIYLAGFPAIFALYVVWACLRKLRYPAAGSPLVMFIGLVAFSCLYVSYRLSWPALGHGANESDIYLGAVLMLTLLYRVTNALVPAKWRST